jgi:tRNA-dihydrouridine synthase A
MIVLPQTPPVTVAHRLSVAPMMDRTDRHFRYFMRQITQHTLLYTEMVTSAAILHGDRYRLLGFSPAEKPLALQVGGDDPKALAFCAQIATEMGYDEINLNVGCPSDRVQNGNFGACLMAQPQRVADCVAAMRQVTSIPVTVKHRIGIDDRDAYEDMVVFVQTVAAAGCERFSVHARLKQAFPHLVIEINGGIQTLEQAAMHLQQVDAVMIGRAAYDNPYQFALADQCIYGSSLSPPNVFAVVEAMLPYIECWTGQGLKLHKITRHMLQLFAGQPGSRLWKRYLTEHSSKSGAGVEVIQFALAQVTAIQSQANVQHFDEC